MPLTGREMGASLSFFLSNHFLVPRPPWLHSFLEEEQSRGALSTIMNNRCVKSRFGLRKHSLSIASFHISCSVSRTRTPELLEQISRISS